MRDSYRDTIRQARAEDAERVGEIARLAWQGVFDSWRKLMGEMLFMQHHAEWKQHMTDHFENFVREHPERAIVTEVDGVIAGFLTWYLPGPEGVGEIGGIAVHPDYQGRGIGERQCKRAIEIFREMGLTSATVYTGLDEGHAPARKMYERAGFDKSTPHIKYFLEL